MFDGWLFLLQIVVIVGFPHAIASLFPRIGAEHTRPDRAERAQRGTRDLYFDTVALLDYGIHDHFPITVFMTLITSSIPTPPMDFIGSMTRH
jgi:hypothetical protein